MKNEIIASTFNRIIVRLVFRIFLYLSKFGYSEQSKSEVYDSLGPIDTLGSRTEFTKYTFFYSNEMVTIFGIKLPFGCSVQYHDGEEKEVLLMNTRIKMFES